MVTTAQKDRFMFAAESEDERKMWMRDLEEAKTVTHANMIKLSVENQCLAEEKGAACASPSDLRAVTINSPFSTRAFPGELV